MSYFAEPHDHSKNEIKIQLDLPSYETQFNLKNAIGANTSKFAKTADLANLKSEVSKLEVDKLVELDADKL